MIGKNSDLKSIFDKKIPKIQGINGKIK